MKFRNRILSIIMVLAMLATSMVVFADDTVADVAADTAVETEVEEVEVVEEDTSTKMPAPTEKLYGKLALLEALGFFEDMTALKLDEAVTRDVFAGWLEKVANLTGEKPYTTVEFSDVSAESANYAAIQNVVSAGYMSGMGGSVFMPSAAITLTDAAASLVRLVGKEAYANLRGGYPTGYEVTARSIGLYDGVKTGVNTTVNVLVMMYNALRASYLAPDGLSSKGIIYDSGETVLSFFHNIYEVEGRMTANGYTKTYSDEVISKTNSVEIDKLIYDCNNSKVHDLIGRYVQGFYRLDEENDTREIVSAYADEDDNTIMELESRELSTGGNNLRLVGLTLYYPIDGGAREKKIELKPGFDFIYNNRAVPTRLDEDILVPDGELTFIDSNNDRKYDIVIAKARETDKVTGIDNYINAVYTENHTIQKADYDGAVFIIKKQDKKTGVVSEVTIDEIAVNAVVTIYSSLDGVYNEIITCEQSDIVTPTGFGDEEDVVYAGDKAYEYADVSAKADVIIGFSSEFYLDYLGRLAYVVKTLNLDYSYGYTFKMKENFEEEVIKLKLLTQYGEKEYPLHDRVLLDNMTKTAEEIYDHYKANDWVHDYEIIRFRLDSKGYIRGIDTLLNEVWGCRQHHLDNPDKPKACGVCDYDERHNRLKKEKDEVTKYNSSGKSFGPYAQYIVGRATFQISVPSNNNERDDIKNYATYIRERDTTGDGNNAFAGEIYDWDNEGTLEVGVVLEKISGSMNAPSIDRNSPSGVVSKVYRIWEDGEDVLKIDLMDNGKMLSYVIDEEIINAFTMEDYGFGDVVAYEINNEGKLVKIESEFDAHDTKPQKAFIKEENKTDHRGTSDYRLEYGKVIRRFDEYVIVQPSLTTEVSDRTTVPIGTINDFTIVDMTQRSIIGGNKQYFSTEAGGSSPSYIYAMTHKNGSCKELVAYKY